MSYPRRYLRNTLPLADYTSYFNSIEQKGKELVDAIVSDARKDGVNANGEVLRTISSTVEAILEASDRHHANLIDVGQGLWWIQEVAPWER
ncbi:MAG: hypothetical protein JRN15_17140, partial [Nitrososphaerota archaeon]|nr:hypothetical protein [Nitrososphaerota archaeon]